MTYMRSAFLLLIVAFSLMSAQESPPLRGRAAERLEQWKQIRLMEKLQMSEEVSIRFFARYRTHTDELRTLGRERAEVIEGLAGLAKKKGNEADIERSLGDLGMLEEKVATTRSSFLEELKSILTIHQIAAYVVFERDFNQNIREIMQEVAKERMERRPLR